MLGVSKHDPPNLACGLHYTDAQPWLPRGGECLASTTHIPRSFYVSLYHRQALTLSCYQRNTAHPTDFLALGCRRCHSPPRSGPLVRPPEAWLITQPNSCSSLHAHRRAPVMLNGVLRPYLLSRVTPDLPACRLGLYHTFVSAQAQHASPLTSLSIRVPVSGLRSSCAGQHCNQACVQPSHQSHL